MTAGLALTVAALVLSGARPVQQDPAMVKVGPGTVRSAYVTPGGEPQEVQPFLLDALPVTNADFLAFVRTNEAWRRDKVRRLYADETYLAHWSGPLDLGPSAPPRAPVTQVSWFAARAYCKAKGSRLPLELEWELAAAASETKKDAGKDPAFVSKILGWYSRPTPKVLPDVGTTGPNAWGAWDLHTLVWEWVDDFGNNLVTGDSRDPNDADTMRFCGAGAIGAGDKSDYAAFMRSAFRSSLKGPFTVKNLGFRCARSLPSRGVTP